MDPPAVVSHHSPWYEVLNQEETRAEGAGMPCGWVCADGSDVAEARAELMLGGNTAEENCCEAQPVLLESVESDT